MRIEDIVCSAKEKGLDAICVTDHDSMGIRYAALDYGRSANYRIFIGIEVSAMHGDIIVFGPDIDFRTYMMGYPAPRKQRFAQTASMCHIGENKKPSKTERSGICEKYAPSDWTLPRINFRSTARISWERKFSTSSSAEAVCYLSLQIFRFVLSDLKLVAVLTIGLGRSESLGMT